MIARLGFYMLVILPLALAGCGKSDEIADAVPAAQVNGVDPALASALQGQIMVDPNLTQQSNADAVRPPAQPYSAGIPVETVAANGQKPDLAGLMKAPAPVQAGKACKTCKASRDSVTLGALAQRQGGTTGACASAIRYGAGWAQRLPADLPLFPQARVTEAAGTEGGQCALRVVSFSASQPMQVMLDWYYTRATRAGYSSEHQVDGDEHILGGTRDRDGGAYVLYMTSREDGGTDIDLVANNGV
ncbi:hypothetical protein TPR58_17015 [Sphingomonas sp. HF-S3]|uniref:Lipoprotein n=1 Tax=Sphingomonas rustica TaxID=3103142 RepID=A0ABV0BBF4_9SPHN